MDKISRLVQQDLDVFRNKKIVIIGDLLYAKQLYKVFCFLGFDVIAICDNSNQKPHWGLPIVTRKNLKKVLLKYNNVIVQFSAMKTEEIEIVKNELEDIGLEYSHLLFSKLLFSFNPMVYFNSLKNPFYFIFEYIGWYVSAKLTVNCATLRYRLLGYKENTCVICLSPKTADVSVTDTLKQFNDIHFINVWHRVRLVNSVIFKKHRNKIITAVREPVSQNLSGVYQNLSLGSDSRNWIFGYLQGENLKDKRVLYNKLKCLFLNDFNNPQAMFEEYIQRYVYPENNFALLSTHPRSMQHFAKEFNKTIFDYMQFPFDKEKGYTIIKDGNVELFIYQLEKLNDIIPALSTWVGVEFDELVRGNQATDKWIAESYTQAQKEIEISQEYFDKCFEEPYVKHCYSEADIKKFKARWRPHIKQ